MALEYANVVRAFATVTHSANGAGVKPTYAVNNGFTPGAGAHTAAGVYVLQLDSAVDPATSVALVCPATGTDATAFGVITSGVGGVSVTVHVLEGAALSDADDFSVLVLSGPNSP